MKAASVVTIRESMSLAQACDALGRLAGGKIDRVQDVQLKDGELVVFLRRPTLPEKMKMALMSSAMRREANHPAYEVFKDIAVRSGIPADSPLLANVRDAIERGDGARLREGLVKVGLSSANRQHGDLF